MTQTNQRFLNKVALVTGGASGIGAATCRRIAEEGGRVVVADMNAALGQSFAKELGKDAMFVALDISDENGWKSTMATVMEKCGRLDVLVNSAGVTGLGTIEDTTSALWHKVMNINAFGTFLACQSAVEAMRKSGGGSIVNVGSALSVKADANRISYCASKAAVLHITRCVALHCGTKRYNIRCNAVMPGVIDTPLLGQVRKIVGSEEALQERMAGVHAIGRMGQPEEVAATIAFLASDDAAFVTSACYAVDGGMIDL